MAANPRLEPALAQELLALVAHAFEGVYTLAAAGLYLGPEGGKGEVEILGQVTRPGAPANLATKLDLETCHLIAGSGMSQIPVDKEVGLSGWSRLGVKVTEDLVLVFWAKEALGALPLASSMGVMVGELMLRWTVKPARTTAAKAQPGPAIDDLDSDVTDTRDLETMIGTIAKAPAPKADVSAAGGIFTQFSSFFLEHPNAGFLCFRKDGRVVPLYPKGQHPYFGQLDKDTDALDILLNNWVPFNRDSASFNQSAPDVPMLRDLMETVFLRITSLDVLKEMLPNELRRGDMVLRLDYRYLQSPVSVDEDLILVLLTDASGEAALQRKIVEEKAKAEMIVKIAMDLEGYDQYRKASDEILRSIMVELEKPSEEIRAASILGLIKTLQSGAEIFEIQEIAQVTQEFETAVTEAAQAGNEFDADSIVQLMMMASEVKDCFDRVQSDHLENLVSDQGLVANSLFKITESRVDLVQQKLKSEVIQKTLEQLDQVFDKNYRPFTQLPGLSEITLKRLASLKNYLWSQVSPQATAALDLGFEELKMQPIGLVLKKYGIMAENLCKKQNKQVVISIEGAEIDVPLHRMQDLFSALVHLVRNAVEHGIEKMEERVFLGKDLEGQLKIGAEKVGSNLLLVFEDDGRGLDPQKIREDAVARGTLTSTAAQSLSDQDALNLLFDAENEGNSARGVGLETVYFRVKQLGGHMRVFSELEKGTRIEIELPLTR